ncbi:MAG: hypothetical protein ACYDHN_03720 [Solirubrobacteraceae bacterium]
MPTTKKASTKTGASSHARCVENDRLIKRITNSLDAVHTDLGKFRDSAESEVGDLRQDLAKLVQDARRRAQKLSATTRKDLKRLQKDAVGAAKPKTVAKAKPSRPRAGASKARTKTAARKTAAR